MLDNQTSGAPVWLDESKCSVDEFRRHQSRKTDHADYPGAVEIASEIPIYEGAALRADVTDDAGWRRVIPNGTARLQPDPVLSRSAGDTPTSTR